MRDLLLWMHQLHRRAGAPGVREMGAAVGCSRNKIHDMLTSGRCPHDGSTLFDLAEWLGRQGSRPRLRGDEASEEAFFAELDVLWDAATRFDLLQPPLPPDLPEPGDAPVRMPGREEAQSDRPERAEAPEPEPEPEVPAGEAPPRSRPVRTRPTRPAALPDLDQSRCVLIATGTYEHLPDLPGLPRSALMLAEALTEQQPDPAFGRVDRLIDLDDPRDILRGVHEAADAAEDVLMLYFSGHGLVSRDGELQFATRGTRPDLDYTAVQYEQIRRLVSTSRARRSLIVLDACYSGRALQTMGVHSGLQEAPSTHLLASSGATVVSFTDGDGLPVFTKDLVDILTTGDPEAPELLTVDSIFRLLQDRALEDGRPTPMQRTTGNSQGLALAHNRRHRTPPRRR